MMGKDPHWGAHPKDRKTAAAADSSKITATKPQGETSCQRSDPGRNPIDLDRLAALGELVWPGGGEEIVRLVEESKAGKVPNLTARA